METPSTPTPSANGRGVALGWFVFVCRLGLAALFFMAALTKITDLAGFEERLVLHSPLPTGVATATARYLPWLELTLAFCLLLKWGHREAALVSALLLVAFLVYTAMSPTADCGCLLFPAFEAAPDKKWLYVRDGLALIGAVVVTRWGGVMPRPLPLLGRGWPKAG
jgi:uncharacterized membrane protein YphA (DoxX/SURF4 family)